MNTSIFATRTGQHVMQRYGHLMIMVSANRAFNDAEWAEALDWLVSQVAMCEIGLNFAPSSGPSTRQRDTFAKRPELAGKRWRKMALISDSHIVRGAVTALNWIMASKRPLHAFAPGHLDEALRYLVDGEGLGFEEVRHVVRNVLAHAGVNEAREAVRS